MSKQSDPPSAKTPSAPLPLPVSDLLLQSYVDGRLDADQRQQVEAWLAEHPERAERVADCQRINAALHARFDPILREDIPERFSALLTDAASTSPVRSEPGNPRWRQWVGRLIASPRWLAPVLPLGGLRLASFAATLAWVGVGIGVGWQVRTAPPISDMPPMVRHAAVAYVTYASEVVHPVEVDAGREAHLVAWLSKRLGMNLKAAKLDDVGYALMGGRLLAGTQRPVAQFMYEDRTGRRLTLYIKTQESEQDQSASFRFARESDVNAFYWIDNGTGYVLSGNLARADLLKVANAVYQQLNGLDQGMGDMGRNATDRRHGKST